jgi:AcrR family transcriptional regulator
MSSTLAPTGSDVDDGPARRRLTGRQADTVDRLTAAAVDEVRARGYAGLTVGNVARRAGVAPATAYTYFASKDHLIAEVFWRRLRDLPPVRVDRRRAAAARLAESLQAVGLLVADEPELAAACTIAILASDPDVRRLRDRIGGIVRQRLAAALGDDGDPAMLRVLELAFSGAMLQAGMGYFSYADVGDRMAEAVALLAGGGG